MRQWLRNARRRGNTLLEQAQAANQAVLDNAPAGSLFATGLIGRVELTTGILDVVNAGHPAPFLIRAGTAQPLALPELPDDACLVVLDWHGGHGDTRSTAAGADPDKASGPDSEMR